MVAGGLFMSAAGGGIVAQFMRFGTVGVANTLIGSATILVLTWRGMNPFAANVIGYVLGTLFSFYANSRWTFGARIGGVRLVKFLTVLAIAYGINVAVLSAALRMGYSDLASQLPAMICFTLINFLGQRYFTFKEERSR